MLFDPSFIVLLKADKLYIEQKSCYCQKEYTFSTALKANEDSGVFLAHAVYVLYHDD